MEPCLPFRRRVRLRAQKDPSGNLLTHCPTLRRRAGSTLRRLEALLAAETQSEVADALVEIVGILRHVAYHLADPPYLRPLLEERLAEVRNR